VSEAWAKGMCRVSAIAIAVVSVACSDSIAPPSAKTIELNSIANQRAFAGLAVDRDPEVLVRDANGSPIAGVPVKFSVTAGGGSVAHATAISGPEGRATAGQWVLGRSAGVNSLVASVNGAGSVRFDAEGVAVPTGTYKLATVNGDSLPFPEWLDQIPLVGATLTLSSSRTFTLVVQTTFANSLVEWQTVGSFVPRLPGSLSFYLGTALWKEGTLQENELILDWAPDVTGSLTLKFIKENSQ